MGSSQKYKQKYNYLYIFENYLNIILSSCTCKDKMSKCDIFLTLLRTVQVQEKNVMTTNRKQETNRQCIQ